MYLMGEETERKHNREMYAVSKDTLRLLFYLE